MKKKKEHFTPLKDIIAALFKSQDLPFNPEDAKIWEAWDEAVGPMIAEHAHPSWIRNGRLRVDVSDPIWMQELEFAGNSIMEKLNRRLGRDAVQRIEFRLGSV